MVEYKEAVESEVMGASASEFVVIAVIVVIGDDDDEEEENWEKSSSWRFSCPMFVMDGRPVGVMGVEMEEEVEAVENFRPNADWK